MRFTSLFSRGAALAGLVCVLLAALPAHALLIFTGSIARVANANAYDGAFFCCGEPLIQPGNKALNDDYWVNTVVQPVTYPVAGDYMGTRATDPTGAVQTNYVRWDGACWNAGLIRFCGGASPIGTSAHHCRARPVIGPWNGSPMALRSKRKPSRLHPTTWPN